MREFKVFGLPILLSLIAIVSVYVFYVQEQLQSPSPNWSRSIPIAKAIENTNIEVIHSNKNYKLYIPNEGLVSEITLNEQLDQVDKRHISANVPIDGPFWVGEHESMVYLREGKLYLYTNNEENLIQNEVKGMSSLDHKIIYWSETEVFELSTEEFEARSLLKLNHNIEEVTIVENSNSLIVSYSPRKQMIAIDYYYLESPNTYKRIPLKEMLDSRYLFYIGSSFVESGNRTYIVYTTLSLVSGDRLYTSYYSVIDPSLIKEAPDFESITLYGAEGGFLKQQGNVILKYDNGPKLWFVAKNSITRRDRALNIFEAYLAKGDKWLANPRSRTYELSYVPFYFGDNLIFWKEFNPGTKVQNISAASTDPYLIDKAGQLTKSDLSHATSDTIISLTGGVFMVLMFGLLWIALPLLLLFFLSENQIEEHPKLVNYGVMGLFVLIQLILSKRMLGAAFYYYGPPYLTFIGANIIVILIIATISLFLTRIAKGKEWGNIKEVSYFMVVNSIISMFVIGPYIL